MSAKVIITTQHNEVAWQMANDLLLWMQVYGHKGFNVYVETRDGTSYQCHEPTTSEQRWEMIELASV